MNRNLGKYAFVLLMAPLLLTACGKSDMPAASETAPDKIAEQAQAGRNTSHF